MPGQEPLETLRQLSRRYHHFKQENKREGPTSSRNRLHEAELKNLEAGFERALSRWVTDQQLRLAWSAHFYHNAPPPDGPEVPNPPLFKGHDNRGHLLVLLPNESGECLLLLDDKLVRRLAPTLELGNQRLSALHAEGIDFEEHFEANDEAKSALLEYLDDPSGGAPWRYLYDLYSDGDVDAHFSLTARGHRLMDGHRHGRGGTSVTLS